MLCSEACKDRKGYVEPFARGSFPGATLASSPIKSWVNAHPYDLALLFFGSAVSLQNTLSSAFITSYDLHYQG